MVHIVTLVKQSPDVEAIRIDPKTGAPDVSGAGLKVSDYDKNAVEAAVQLKEAGGIDKVTALSLGGDKLEESIKEVLAMGCDEALLLRDAAFSTADTAEKARLLALGVQKVDGGNLVIAAEESLDSHSGQTGSRVAEQLGWPIVSNIVSDLKVADGKLSATRETDDGLEDIEVALPCVIVVGEALNHPRLPALMQILQAKNKPMTVLDAAGLGAGDITPKLDRPSSVAPKSERKGIMLAGTPEEAAAELAKILSKEGAF